MLAPFPLQGRDYLVCYVIDSGHNFRCGFVSALIADQVRSLLIPRHTRDIRALLLQLHENQAHGFLLVRGA